MDSSNFLEFLQLLRATLPHGAKITAATQVWPFADEKGQPLADVRAFAKLLDWILGANDTHTYKKAELKYISFPDS